MKTSIKKLTPYIYTTATALLGGILLTGCTMVGNPDLTPSFQAGIYQSSATLYYKQKIENFFFPNTSGYHINSTNPRDYMISHELAWGVPSKESYNLIISPWAPHAGYVFVGNRKPRDVVKCPYSGKFLVMPDREEIKEQILEVF